MKKFKDIVWNHYKSGARNTLPWRHTTDPYKIMVSELMLQQTQVSRVIPKYESFIKKFPTLKLLAKASTRDVLSLWQGLGYNRRALNLKKACEQIVSKHKGKFPTDRVSLLALPGIGQSTAGAIMAFAFNIPSVFIETNIRAVYLYHFFSKNSEAASVGDTEILALIAKTVDQKKPRDWYYALYDYGTALKAQLGPKRTKLHKVSKHYSKQSKFEGSTRQIRSNILKAVLAAKYATLPAIIRFNEVLSAIEKPIMLRIIEALVKEGFLAKEGAAAKAAWRIAEK